MLLFECQHKAKVWHMPQSWQHCKTCTLWDEERMIIWQC